MPLDTGRGPGSRPAKRPKAPTAVRRCAVAARLGDEVACPAGGFRLARGLGMAPGPDAVGRCPLEELALRAPACPLAIVSIDGLRRSLEPDAGAGGRSRARAAHRSWAHGATAEPSDGPSVER